MFREFLNRILSVYCLFNICPELKTLEWDILNPDRIINLEIKNERRTSAIFNLEIKKKSGLSINPDIHHSKVFSSELKSLECDILNPDLLINGD